MKQSESISGRNRDGINWDGLNGFIEEFDRRRKKSEKKYIGRLIKESIQGK